MILSYARMNEIQVPDQVNMRLDESIKPAFDSSYAKVLGVGGFEPFLPFPQIGALENMHILPSSLSNRQFSIFSASEKFASREEFVEKWQPEKMVPFRSVPPKIAPLKSQRVRRESAKQAL